ncbi:hypothetical protein [Streptomyces sp. NPDC095817]|uniref:hypothetical protein n=1 Tax=Streptomyces sp. NPDC095817 TaxID=3155082 RepID=UPI00333288FC
MSEDSQPAPARSDMSHLIPTVVPIDGSDPELVAIGERYWSLAGFYPDGTPAWSEKVADIDSQGWGRPLYVVAAAGVRAVAPDLTCKQCEGPLSLTSRSALAELCNGATPACVECTDSLQSALTTVLDPGRKAKRAAAQKRAEEQRAIAAARDAWHAAQREIVAEQYGLHFNDELDPKCSVRESVATLALLRYAPDTARIRVGDWLTPLHPDEAKVGGLCGELVRSGLIAIHPESPAKAFVWKPESFQAALAAADGDMEAVGVPQGEGRFYPTLADYYAPFGTSPGTGATYLDAFLREGLAPERLTAGQQDDLLALALELLTAEAVRYFLYRLDEVNLPAITDSHRQRLEEAAKKAAEHRPLGEIYNLVWRSTRAAAEAAQKNPRAPRTNMSTHAVNQFETHAHHASVDSTWEIKPFNELPTCPPAAMTRTLLYTVLNQTPIEASLPQIRKVLPEPAKEPAPIDDPLPIAPEDPWHDNDVDDVTRVLVWLAANTEAWETEAVLRALRALNMSHPDEGWNVDIRVIQRSAARLQRLHDHLLPFLGQPRTALAVLAASSDLMTHPTTDPENSSETTPVGEVIFHALCTELFKQATNDQDEEADDTDENS